MPKKGTRSSQLKFAHTWGGPLKDLTFTEELLAVNSCLREGEASFFEGVVTDRLPIVDGPIPMDIWLVVSELMGFVFVF